MPASDGRQIKKSGGNIISLSSVCVIRYNNLPASYNLNPRASGWEGYAFSKALLHAYNKHRTFSINTPIPESHHFLII